MVAVASLIPNDPEARVSVLSVLEAHPELRGFIARASAKAEELVPGTSLRLEHVQYDEWDPPLQLVASFPLPWSSYQAIRDTFISWVSAQPDFDSDFIIPMPTWTGLRDDHE